MAGKRMFSKQVIDSDIFLDMPMSTQCLYFHLCMRADDDGFIDNPKKISRFIGASEDDLKLLLAKNFAIGFENGVIVIKHWRLHNTLKNDRYKPTIYQEEYKCLGINESKIYETNVNGTSLEPVWNQNGNADKNRLDKNRLDKNSKEEYIEVDKRPARTPKHKYGEYGHVLLKDDELEKLNSEYGEEETKEAIKYLDEYIEMKGTKYKSHYLALRKWVYEAVKERKPKKMTDEEFLRWAEEEDKKLELERNKSDLNED